MTDGLIVLKDQLRDYQYRGDVLEEMNFLDFMLNTYEGRQNTSAEEQVEDETERGNDEHEQTGTSPKKGRPPNTRIPYKTEANKGTSCRIMRTKGHETMPRFVGKWFNRNDSQFQQEIHTYHASMLMLLKPWRQLTQVKEEKESFQSSFDNMIQSGGKRMLTVIENIQYYYQCADGAKARREQEKQGTGRAVECELMVEESELLEFEQRDKRGDEGHDVTEEEIDAAKKTRIPQRERFFGEQAIIEAYDAGIFQDLYADTTTWKEPARCAEGTEELMMIKAWEKQLKETTRKQANEQGTIDLIIYRATDDKEGKRRKQRKEREPLVEKENPGETASKGERRERTKLAMLNTDQRRAHDIVESRLRDYISSKRISGPDKAQTYMITIVTEHEKEPLRMIILGPGGTGKSMLISAITETFEHYGKEDILSKCATTGIAASDIGGKTLHSWAGLSINVPKGEDWQSKASSTTSQKRRVNIEGKEFTIIDEISMADKVILYCTSEVVGSTRAKEFKGSAEDPFGGMNVILAGDFHQFPPVGNASGALYVEKEDDSARAKIGREVFKQFETVVILNEQIRMKDKGWSQMLDKLRVGECSHEDIEEIKKLVLSNPNCERPDFQQEPWSSAVLVTSRHAVREQWNEHSTIKHCNVTGNIRYSVNAEDIDKDTKQEPCMEARLAIAELEAKQTGKLKDEIQLAIGMKAMVLLNLATEADIANGTRGEIKEIILDDREDQHRKPVEGHVNLQYPPAMILFKPDRGTNIKFEGISPGLIPITPSEASFAAQRKGKGNKTYKIKRRQYAITPGYAFTDYKSQGQTIEHVIIDIGKPPTGKLSPFGTYVSLSRSRGRDTIRLLRDFDEELFQHHPSEHLRKDMIRLEALNEKTKKEHTKHTGSD